MTDHSPQISDCLNQAISSTRLQGSSIPQEDSPIRYIWLHVTRDGIAGEGHAATDISMLLNDWLNLVDESAALGAQWMIVYLDTPINEDSDVWRICAWAQEVHALKVGLHINSQYVDTWSFDSLTKLKKDKTFIVADQSMLSTLQDRNEDGFTLCRANISDDDRQLPCTHTDSIVCARTDGVMFCCGLVVGEESYRLGNVRSDPVNRAMQKHAELEPILVGGHHTPNGCDGCPPIMVQRFMQQEADNS